MPERTEAEQAQRVEALRTPFRAHIEAAFADRGLRLVHAYDYHEPGLFDVPGTIRTITYIVAPAEFQTLEQVNEGVSFLEGLDRTHFAETADIGEDRRKTIPLSFEYGTGLDEDTLTAFRIGRVHMYEPTGLLTTTTQQTLAPREGMEQLYQVAGIPSLQEPTTEQHFVRHEVFVYPRLDVAEAVATHLTNPEHEHEGLIELVAHGQIPTPDSYYLSLPFDAIGGIDFARQMAGLPPLTWGQRRLRAAVHTISDLLAPHDHAGHSH